MTEKENMIQNQMISIDQKGSILKKIMKKYKKFNK